MTISYLLGFSPKWVVLDNTGRPAAGGKLYTYSNLDKDQPKAAYSDQAGNNPYTNPILFDANGTKGPIFFANDSADPTNTYYLRMYAADGTFLWDEDNYSGAGSGGGGVVTSDVDITNLITNNIFWYTDKTVDAQFATSTSVRLAPSCHDNFIEGANTNGPTGPDIVFAKNNGNATDFLEFISFTLGSSELIPDITPQYFLRYSCTVLGAAESYKWVQYPITPKVQNLSNSTVTAVIYARCTAGSPTLQLYLRQFYGDGASASAESRVPLGSPIALTSTWTKYSVSGTVPDATGKTIGECHNDALFLQVGYPLGQVSTIDHVKVALYTGDFDPDVEFLTMDQIDAVTMTPRVGETKSSISNVVPFGYLPMNNGTIGNPSSNATNRANFDTFGLYSTIWNSCHAVPQYAPIYTSAGALSTFGGSAVADFSANKQLSLTKMLGQVIAGTSTVIDAAQVYTADHNTAVLTLATNAVRMGTGTPVILNNSGGAPPAGLSTSTIYYAIFGNATQIALATTLNNALAGTFIAFTDNGTGTNTIIVYSDVLGNMQGEKAHILTVPEIPAHTHTVALSIIPNILSSGGGQNALGSGPINTGSTGGGGAHNTMQPTTFMNVFIKY